MIKQDLIERAIEQIGHAITALIGQKPEDAEQVLVEVEKAKGLFPVVPGYLSVATPEQAMQALQSSVMMRQLAELFRRESAAYKAQGKTKEALGCLQRSFALFEYVDAHADD